MLYLEDEFNAPFQLVEAIIKLYAAVLAYIFKIGSYAKGNEYFWYVLMYIIVPKWPLKNS
jgi:hypothetical protein